MKRGIVAATLAMTVAGHVLAAEGPAAPGPARPDGRVVIFPGQAGAPPGPGQFPGGSRSPAAWYIESIERDVALTDEQKQAMTGIIEARDKAVIEWQRANAERLKAASAAMAEASRSQDREAFVKAQKEYQEQYAAMHEIMKEHQTQLQNVLTAEQQTQQRDARLAYMIRASAGQADLSPEQIARVKDLLAPESSPEAAARKVYEVVQQVLTPDQKRTVAKQRAMSYVKGLYMRAMLTEQQQQQAEAICDELAAHDMTPAEAFRTLKEKVDALLTAEQQETLKTPPGLAQPPTAPAIPGPPPAGWPAPPQSPRPPSDPTIQELRSEVEALRRQVQELKGRLESSSRETR